MSIYSKSHINKQIDRFSGGFAQDFGVVETILRQRDQFFEEIRDQVGIQEKIQAMLVSSTAFMAAYGAILGSTHSLLQALSSAIKLPILFLATMLICIPTLYIFSLLFGSNQRLNQTLAVVLSAITIKSVLLLSLAPITFFFLLTTSGYQFFKLLNVFFFAIAGIVGVLFLIQGTRLISSGEESTGTKKRNFILYLWIFLYMFVGSQMAWTLRPFVGYPGSQLEIIRELGGNFYADIFHSIGELLGFFIVM
jgi:hypothetical protein